MASQRNIHEPPKTLFFISLAYPWRKRLHWWQNSRASVRDKVPSSGWFIAILSNLECIYFKCESRVTLKSSFSRTNYLIRILIYILPKVNVDVFDENLKQQPRPGNITRLKVFQLLSEGINLSSDNRYVVFLCKILSIVLPSSLLISLSYFQSRKTKYFSK